MKTASEFIAFFEAIPEEKWCIGTYFDRHAGQCCAQGHLGRRPGVCNQDTTNLSRLFDEIGEIVVYVNDGDSSRFTQSTPKQRILAALREIEGKV